MSDVPERLKRRGRPVDPNFDPEERLYRRVPRRDFIGRDGYVLPAGVRFPDISVNRGKYSEPEDVVLGYENAAAIAAARVRDIPDRIDEYEFRPEHVPKPQNYAHSEIRAFLGGRHLKEAEDRPPRAVRDEFRVLLGLKVIRKL